MKSDTEVLDSLVARAREGDEAAMGSIVDQTQGRLFRFCFHLCGNRHFAEDLCQEAFVKAFKQLATLRENDRFLGWLYQIARNRFLDEKRKKSDSEELLDSEVEESYASTLPEQDTGLEVRRTLQQLEPSEREVLILVDIEEYSYQEAAEIIGVSENALRSRVHRARQAFIQLFSSGLKRTAPE